MARIKIRNGFTLVETLLSLSIVILMVFSFVSIVSLMRHQKNVKVITTNTEIGIKSLSQDLYLTKSFSLRNSTLRYIDQDGVENQVYLDNQRVVREPGFVIYMHDIKKISFYQIDNRIYMKVSQENLEKTFLHGDTYLVKRT